jgi:hypothetical protein
MGMESVGGADDRVVVGYFASDADGSRAIDELLDEGFVVSEIGAAFRTPVSGMEVADGGRVRAAAPENPALAGSVGGAGSHDEAVTPAELSPGSGNAFPSPAPPGPIPGGGIPSTLRHELRHELPAMLRPEAPRRESIHPPASSPATVPAAANRGRRPEHDAARHQRMRTIFGESPESQKARRDSALRYGAGEGRLFAESEYSEPAFENSFIGMGLDIRDARILSRELGRGGAVVSITPGSRASLAEAILQRNHGRVRFESVAASGQACDGNRVAIYGRMRSYYRDDDELERKAS